ncbi:hypothetical protein GUG50_14200, partial [Xanthomonas citri pv. citri]|nr:hypothetical protein [Xanthomonas citri pv. citri]
MADLLRLLGPLSVAEAARRTRAEGETEEAADEDAVAGMLAELERAGRAFRLRQDGVERFAAVEDAARLRDALGTPIPH